MRMPPSRATVLFTITLLTLTAAQARQVNPSVFGGLSWRSIGPPRSGYVSSPAGVPGDPTTYYVGLPEGGVWKTTTAGTTWKPIFDSVRVASVGAVAVAPSDPNVVYVGTGNQSGWSFTIGKGVYKSTDAGRTWTNIGLTASHYIGGLAVDPRNARNVLVAVLGPRAGGPESAERGVYRSTDGGGTWTRVLPADGSSGASDVYLDYGDPQIVYARAPAAPGQPPAPAGSGTGTWVDRRRRPGSRSRAGLPAGVSFCVALASGAHDQRLPGGRGPACAARSSEDGGVVDSAHGSSRAAARSTRINTPTSST